MSVPVRALLGKLFAGQPDDFHGADDAARIFLVNRCKRRRVAFAQFGQQIFQRRGFQFGAQGGVAGGRVAKAFEKRPEIKPGAAAKNRNFIP